MASDKGFLDAWSVLESAFGVQDIPKMESYRALLRDCSDQDLMVAALRTGREFNPRDEKINFPVPYYILSRIPGSLSADTKADNAWNQVKDALNYTTYDPINGDRPHGRGLSEEALAAIGGLRGLDDLYRLQDKPAAMSWARKEFIERFKHGRENVNAGLLPTGEPIHHDELMGGDVIDEDHLLEDNYDA
jgi:hypothetical protein